MKNRFILLALIFSLIFVYYIYEEDEKETIKIGFVSALTGKYSVLGNSLKNGMLLAFEEEDYLINGKKIEIIFKDDKQNEEVNKKIINSFIEDDINIIFGNATSSMSKVSLEIVNKHKDVFLISPTTSSNQFSKKDDQFLRSQIANNKMRFDSYSKYLIQKNYKNIYALYDPLNLSYTMDYIKNLEKSLIENGGNKFLNIVESDTNLEDIASDIKEKNPDLIVICANSVDSSKLLQYIRVNNIKTKVAIAEWARTRVFLENTGKTSNGVIVNFDYDEASKNQKFIDFVNNYKQRYALEPSVHAARSYELAKIIIESLKLDSALNIKKTILKKKRFEGLQGDVVFDKYGDVTRTMHNFEIQNGKYVKIK